MTFTPAALWQRDPKWASVHLGTSQAKDTSNLSRYGCLATDCAYIANSFMQSDKYTPVDVQMGLLANDGFDAGDPKDPSYNLIRFWVLEKFLPVHFVKSVSTPGPLTAAQQAEIAAHITAGIPIIVGVDYTGAMKVANHYVVITSMLYDVVSVNSVNPPAFRCSIFDPYYGTQGEEITKRYGDSAVHAIMRYMIFSSMVVPPAPSLIDSALFDKYIASSLLEAERDQARLHSGGMPA